MLICNMKKQHAYHGVMEPIRGLSQLYKPLSGRSPTTLMQKRVYLNYDEERPRKTVVCIATTNSAAHQLILLWG